MRNRWSIPFCLPSPLSGLYGLPDIIHQMNIYSSPGRSTLHQSAEAKAALTASMSRYSGSCLFLALSTWSKLSCYFQGNCNPAVVWAMGRGLLFRFLEPGDSQPGWEAGAAAGLAELLQGAGCGGISLFPVFVFSKKLHHRLLWCKPFLHFPKTGSIWLLDSWPYLVAQFDSSYL